MTLFTLLGCFTACIGLMVGLVVTLKFGYGPIGIVAGTLGGLIGGWLLGVGSVFIIEPLLALHYRNRVGRKGSTSRNGSRGASRHHP